MATVESINSNTSNSVSNHMPWVEKYRPKKISDVSCQNEVIQALTTSVQSGHLPHLLFYGPPGSGKTSTILAFCHEIYGDDVKDRVLEMNASDERGIAVIREKIKTFAQRSVSSKNQNIPPFKIIILDECDNMTGDAQSALRRIIENYTKVTRFCLICNYISRIIPPLASRCAKFRYKLLSCSSMVDRLKYIASKENISISNDDVFVTLYNISNGDMRKSIQILQNAYLLYGNNINNNEIYEMAGKVPKERIDEIFAALKSFIFDNVNRVINGLVQDGYSAATIINEFFECLKTSELFDDKQRSDICLSIAHSDYALSKGADEYLQLMSIMSTSIQALLGEL